MELIFLFLAMFCFVNENIAMGVVFMALYLLLDDE
jgi:hypothetical protein